MRTPWEAAVFVYRGDQMLILRRTHEQYWHVVAGVVERGEGYAEAATTANHHPDIHVERYKTVRIVLTTHATGGISDADVALARTIEGIE